MSHMSSVFLGDYQWKGKLRGDDYGAEQHWKQGHLMMFFLDDHRGAVVSACDTRQNTDHGPRQWDIATLPHNQFVKYS